MHQWLRYLELWTRPMLSAPGLLPPLRHSQCAANPVRKGTRDAIDREHQNILRSISLRHAASIMRSPPCALVSPQVGISPSLDSIQHHELPFKTTRALTGGYAATGWHRCAINLYVHRAASRRDRLRIPQCGDITLSSVHWSWQFAGAWFT